MASLGDSSIFALAHFKAAHDDVGDQGKNKEHQQHPRNALQRRNDGAVQLQNPAFPVERECKIIKLRRDIFFKLPNANTARNADDIDGKNDVASPRRSQLFRHQPIENCRDRVLKQLDD